MTFRAGLLRLTVAAGLLGSALPSAHAFTRPVATPPSDGLLHAIADPATEFRKLLLPHAFHGERVTDAMRRASGDPGLVVIDRRWQWGEIYSCNYQFIYKKRVLVCE